MAVSKVSRATIGVYRSTPPAAAPFTTRDMTGAMPCSISKSVRSATPRSRLSRCAHATSNRLWLPTPMRTARHLSGRNA